MWVCFNAKGGKTDDWLISPQLSGTAQTISFFAKSTKPNYGNESFEVLASSTGKETADFVLVKAVESVPGEWTKYDAELPAGTSYMAIRCTSNDIFALAIDDITLLTAEAAVPTSGSPATASIATARPLAMSKPLLIPTPPHSTPKVRNTHTM